MHRADGDGCTANDLTIRVVLVLYRMSPAQSPAFRALQELLAGDAAVAKTVRLTICDNTPGQVEDPVLPDARYHHNPSNPGLARSYNLALQHAKQAGDRWLLLLDQDTSPTPAYFAEALARAQEFEDKADVVAIVPKLIEHGVVQSPHRERMSLHPAPLEPDFFGLCEEPLTIFNSGAVIRVSQLQKIGGFPEDFWLDFLDHATFHLLRREGGRVFVMQAALLHQVSSNVKPEDWDRTFTERQKNLLAAEAKFYGLYGTGLQKRWYRIRLLRHAYGSLKHLHFPMLWQLMCTLVRVR
ncbi:MAG: glycosyltransferase [Janthinobacterium lividum]